MAKKIKMSKGITTIIFAILVIAVLSFILGGTIFSKSSATPTSSASSDATYTTNNLIKTAVPALIGLGTLGAIAKSFGM